MITENKNVKEIKRFIEIPSTTSLFSSSTIVHFFTCLIIPEDKYASLSLALILVLREFHFSVSKIDSILSEGTSCPFWQP